MAVHRRNEWRRRQVVLDGHTRDLVRAVAGGAGEPTRALVASRPARGDEPHMVSLSMVDTAIQELEQRRAGFAARRDRAPIDDALGHLRELRAAWRRYTRPQGAGWAFAVEYDTADYGTPAADEARADLRSR